MHQKMHGHPVVTCGKSLLNTVDTMSVTGRGRNQSFCSWQAGQNSNLDHLFLARIPKPKQSFSASLLVEFCHWWLFLWLLFHLHIRLFLARTKPERQQRKDDKSNWPVFNAELWPPPPFTSLLEASKWKVYDEGSAVFTCIYKELPSAFRICFAKVVSDLFLFFQFPSFWGLLLHSLFGLFSLRLTESIRFLAAETVLVIGLGQTSKTILMTICIIKSVNGLLTSCSSYRILCKTSLGFIDMLNAYEFCEFVS